MNTASLLSDNSAAPENKRAFVTAFRRRTNVSICVSALGIALASGMATAGTATMQSDQGGGATFEYNESMLRINSIEDSGGYAIVRDGKMYAVVDNDGNPMVIDAGSMMKNFASMAPQAVQTDIAGRVIKLEKTGRSETVAGIKGEVYELQVENEEGEIESGEMVLSSDKRAREFRDALFLMMEVAAQMGGDDAAAAADDMQERLKDMNMGVLRYGDEMVISSIDGAAVDPARFELPAEPMNLDGLGAMLGGMTQDPSAGAAANDGEAPKKKGGLFSSMMGAIGGQADRQAGRVDDAVEDEINEEADEQVDNAIGKAFGKLFGRK